MNNELSVIRQRFDEGDTRVADRLPDAIRDSWLRCANQTIQMSGQLEYAYVRPDNLKELKSKNSRLLNISNRHVEQLFQAVAGAGWSVLLTDKNCTALQVRQASRLRNTRIASAFRDGVVLNESTVGTTAMSCAVNSSAGFSVQNIINNNTTHFTARQLLCLIILAGYVALWTLLTKTH